MLILRNRGYRYKLMRFRLYLVLPLMVNLPKTKTYLISSLYFCPLIREFSLLLLLRVRVCVRSQRIRNFVYNIYNHNNKRLSSICRCRVIRRMVVAWVPSSSATNQIISHTYCVWKCLKSLYHQLWRIKDVWENIS